MTLSQARMDGRKDYSAPGEEKENLRKKEALPGRKKDLHLLEKTSCHTDPPGIEARKSSPISRTAGLRGGKKKEKK